MRSCIVARYELDVSHRPIEQPGGTLQIVKTFTMRPTSNITEPDGFLQQLRVAGLKAATREGVGRNVRGQLFVVANIGGKRIDQRRALPIGFRIALTKP